MHARLAIALPVLLAFAPPAMAAQEQAGGFVTRRGGREVARERYRFDGRTLRAEVELLGQGLFVETETVFEDRGVPGRYLARVRPAPGGAPITEVHAAFTDSVRWSLQGGARVEEGAAPIRRPLVVIQNSVFAQLALAIHLHGRRAGGSSALYAWRPEGGQVSTVGLAIAGSEATVQLGGVRMNAELDPAGWIRRLTLPAQSLVVEWRPDIPLSTRSLTEPADTLPPPGVIEEAVAIGGGALSATLALPGTPGPVPVAVIVAPSGDVDRDGNRSPAVRPNIALLGTPARPFMEVLRHRLAASTDRLGLAQFDSATARFLRGEPQAGLPLHLDLLLRPAGHRYLASLAAYQILSELRRVDVPVLVLHGDRDTQVPVADAELLRTAATHGDLAVMAGVNHLFKDAGLENRVGMLALEMDPRVPVVPALIERIVVWVNR